MENTEMTPRQDLDALRKTLEPHPEYILSSDYDLALNLLDGGCLFGLCLYDTMNDGYKLFDVCRIKKQHSTVFPGYSVGVRGIQYFSAHNVEEFKELCAKYEVRLVERTLPPDVVEVIAKARVVGMALDSGDALALSFAGGDLHDAIARLDAQGGA